MTTPHTSARLPTPLPRLRRGLLRPALAPLLAGALLAGPLAVTASAHDPLPPGRRIVEHTVQPGDTATGLAVRYHAWTAELVDLNHLGSDAILRVGEQVRVPVVVTAARQDRPRKRTAPERAARPSPSATTSSGSGEVSREKVRRAITGEARRLGVDPDLALAVSWQESGWQMHRVSSANAIGAMQVLPDTATWMELYAGRSLDPHKLADNVSAGVWLLRVLDGLTDSRRHQLAAYYQGLGAVREHGLYDETRGYVANVAAIHRRLSQGMPPA